MFPRENLHDQLWCISEDVIRSRTITQIQTVMPLFITSISAPNKSAAASLIAQNKGKPKEEMPL